MRHPYDRVGVSVSSSFDGLSPTQRFLLDGVFGLGGMGLLDQALYLGQRLETSATARRGVRGS